MALKVTFIAQISVLLQLFYLSKGCILLLNGWDPLSVYERTEKADVVVGAKVLRAFKTERTDAGTYTAKVRLLEVYKGGDLVRNISTSEYKVYNITNFGDKTTCYADLTEGRTYLLFLTLFDGRLSAKYDDIFGAASDFNPYNEQEVLDYLGWDYWSEWSSCTKNCNSGHQTRTRTCERENVTDCEGEALESRQCNTFACEDQEDLLYHLGIPKEPLGVTQDSERTSAYVITSRAKLFLPVSTLYGITLPRDFAVVVTLKLEPGFHGYLLSISDIKGRQRVGIFFGDGVVRFDYLDDNYFGITMPTFDVNVTDGRWHQLAMSLSGTDVTLFMNCDTVIKKTLKRSTLSSFGTNLMLSVGPYFPRYGNPFTGSIEQLVISENTEIAKLQCYVQTGNRIEPIGDGSSGSKSVAMTTTLPTPTTTTEALESEWSEWSSCSSTCGKGRQTRSIYCRNNVLSVDRCFPRDHNPIQSRLCFLQQCEGARMTLTLSPLQL